MDTLVKMIDHTILKPQATTADIKKLCEEAKQYGFASVCINSRHVRYAAELLKGTAVKVCTVVGFPLGAGRSEVKAFEAKLAQEDGATEIDMVIDIGAAKEHDYDRVKSDIETVREAVPAGNILKVIIETCLLTDEEKVAVCLAAKAAGADFVKTSTGFSSGGATAEDVALMKKTVGTMAVKASGGIHNKADALKMVEAGATRLGCSAGVAIANGD